MIGVVSIPSSLVAQGGIQYMDLLRRQQQQQVYIDQIALPTPDPDKVEIASLIKIQYPFLSFKKSDQTYSGNSGKAFYAPSGFNVELYNIPEGHKPPKKRKDLMELNISQFESVERSAWKDTAFAATYEQTQYKEKYLTGYSTTSVPAGFYYYLFQLNRPDSNTPMTPMRKPLRVQPYNQIGEASFYILKQQNSDQRGGALMLMGNNVHYGKDFDLLVQLPQYEKDGTYNLTIKQLDVQDSDTTTKSTQFEYTIDPQQVKPASLLELRKDNQELILRTQTNNQGYRFAQITIPNSSFPNAYYRIILEKEGSSKPLGDMVYQSKWVDIPVSLLNVEVAINMLRYITSDSNVKNLLRGNQSEKEQNFNDFWSKRDPTPDTPYNELMAEYYRRIDYAFREYSTPNKPGFNTDQGKVYISYGPPQNIDRRFPTDSRAIEIWEYPGKTFRFQATSGFGDFKLIEQTSK
ncbi:MAG: GWxTD domain-containing protein [Bacteroidota bacterium]